MLHRAIATLGASLGPHLGLSKDRVETLALIVVAMVSARTVNLSHLAAERPGAALVASTYRRLQRFFQHVRLGPDWAAPLAAELAGLRGSRAWYLTLDRTQWRIGRHEVNFLVLAAVTRRFRVPPMWTLIPGRGNSSTRQRIALMRRYLRLFEVSTIRLLLADREFIGQAWTDFLCENNIPFAIRLRDELRVTSEEGHQLRLDARLHWRRRGKVLSGWLGAGSERGRHRLSFAAKPLRQAPPRRRVADHRHQCQAPLRPRRLRQALGHRMPVRRRQDPRPQPRGHPPHRPGQAWPPHGPRGAGHRLGRPRRQRPPRHPLATAQGSWISQKVMVPHRL